MSSDADVVVVGAGHNGLVCAAYLAGAGLDVVVVERRSVVGGCASSVDVLGTTVNICNCDHSMIRASGIIEDLGLAQFGLEYLELDPIRHYLTVASGPGIAGRGPSGSGGHDRRDPGWWIFPDVERTLDGLAVTHPGEVDNYRRYIEDLTPVAKLLLELTSAPPTPGRVMRKLVERRAEAIGRLLRLSRLSVGAALGRYFDLDALIAPACASGPAVWGLAPDTPGSGLGALGYAMAHLVPTGRPVGGSGALTDALAAVISAKGGRIRCGAEVTEIACENGTVRGVVLANGEELRAATVVCAADPRKAFVSWLTNPPEAAAKTIGRWRSRPELEGYESKIDAVIAAPPVFQADDCYRDRLGLAGPGGETTIITPSVSGIGAAHRLARTGKVADQPIFFANTPDLLDPTVAPTDGGHTFSLEVLFTPWHLVGGWAGSSEPQRWIDTFASHVQPEFGDGVRRWRVVTPEDYDREFGLTQGHAPSFPGGPLAALIGRDRELTRYSTPVPGLYLTGAGTFPGAGVWGASGRNAARVVLAATA